MAPVPLERQTSLVTDPSPPGPDAALTVRHLLAAAGLHPPEEDLRTLIAQYGDVRRRLEAMWAVDVGEDEPATIYRASTGHSPEEQR